MKKEEKTLHENFYKFLKNPSKENLHEFLNENFGELDECDFKSEWPILTKISKIMLGIANSGGGIIVIGVTQKDDNTFDPIGIENMQDKSDIRNGIKKYIPEDLKYDVLDIKYEDQKFSDFYGRKFQIIMIEDIATHIPFISMADGDSIKINEIYVRKGTNTEKASYIDLQKIINRRVESTYSSSNEIDLREQLNQLKILYGEFSTLTAFGGLLSGPILTQDIRDNYKSYIKELISKKRKIIDKLID